MPEQRQRVAQDPRAGLRGERRLGAPGRDPRGRARGAGGPGGGGAAGAHRRPAGEQAAGARRGAGDLAAGAGGRPGQPATRCREIERLGTALERFSELVDVYQELAFKRDAVRHRGRADLLSRAAKLYAGRLGNRRAAIDVWKLVLDLDPERHRHDGAGRGRAGDAVHRDRRRRRPGEDPAPCRCAGPTVGRTRKKILFRIAELRGEVAGRHRRRRWPRCGRSWRSTRRSATAIDALDRIFEAGAQHRQRVEMLRKRIDLAGDATARQELWRQRRRACSSATSATSTRRSPPASASSTRTRRTTRRWRRWRGSTSSRGVTASGWRSSSAAWRCTGRARRGRASCCCGRSRRCWKGRWAIRARRSGAGARCWRRRPATSEAMAALERFLAPGDRRRPAAGGGAGAGADLRAGRPLRRAGGGGARLRRRRRPTRARGSSS